MDHHHALDLVALFQDRRAGVEEDLVTTNLPWVKHSATKRGENANHYNELATFPQNIPSFSVFAPSLAQLRGN